MKPPAPRRTACPVSPLLLLVALAACGPGDTDRPAIGTEAGWVPEAYEPRTDDGIRILVIHDMEGLSGQSDPSSFDYGTDLYPRGQEWLAADVNAVVDGLYAGGATDVLIADGHGYR